MFCISRSLNLFATLAAAALLVAGCSTTGGPTTASDAETTGSGVKLLSYRCENGMQVKASYPTDSVALLRYDEQTYQLHVARAASGVRYVGDTLQWWTKGNGVGSTALLSPRGDESATQTCQQI